MKVILKQDVPSLGKAGDLIKVNDGYARNLLIPKGLAIEANEKNIKTLKHEKNNVLQKTQKEHKTAQDLASTLAENRCLECSWRLPTCSISTSKIP